MAWTKQDASRKKQMIEIGFILLACFIILIVFPALQERNSDVIVGTWQINALVYDDDNGDTQIADLSASSSFIQFSKGGRFSMNLESTGNRAGKWTEQKTQEDKEHPHVYSMEFTDDGDDFKGVISIDDDSNMFLVLLDETDATYMRYTAVVYNK